MQLCAANQRSKAQPNKELASFSAPSWPVSAAAFGSAPKSSHVPADQGTAISPRDMPRTCTTCGAAKGKGKYTPGQWRKADGEGQCRTCLTAASLPITATRPDRATTQGVQFVCFLFLVSCFLFHVSGFMFHVSCFMFHVSGFLIVLFAVVVMLLLLLLVMFTSARGP